MQWDEAGDLVSPVRWYFCPPGTPPLPFQHLYGSSIWQTEGVIDLGPGERWDSDRPYSKGQLPGPQPPAGEFCGPIDWWQNGVPSDAPPLPTNLLGQPDCCISDGGALVGGTSTVNMFPPLTGGLLIGGTSMHNVLFEVAGGIYAGGTSEVWPMLHAYGGVLLGATSRPYVSPPAYGGVLVGGTSQVFALAAPIGGILAGGTSQVFALAAPIGGVLVGGNSTTSTPIRASGGIELGALSTVWEGISCTTWLLSNLGGAGYRLANMAPMTQISFGPTFWRGYAPDMSSIFEFQYDFTHPCGSGQATDGAIGVGMTTYQLVYLGGLNTNATSVWKVPLTCPVYPGEVFLFHQF